jgi:hypothetical protein
VNKFPEHIKLKYPQHLQEKEEFREKAVQVSEKLSQSGSELQEICLF